MPERTRAVECKLEFWNMTACYYTHRCEVESSYTSSIPLRLMIIWFVSVPAFVCIREVGWLLVGWMALVIQLWDEMRCPRARDGILPFQQVAEWIASVCVYVSCIFDVCVSKPRKYAWNNMTRITYVWVFVMHKKESIPRSGKVERTGRDPPWNEKDSISSDHLHYCYCVPGYGARAAAKIVSKSSTSAVGLSLELSALLNDLLGPENNAKGRGRRKKCITPQLA